MSIAPGIGEKDSAELFIKYVLFLSVKKIIEEKLGVLDKTPKWYSPGATPCYTRVEHKRNLSSEYKNTADNTSNNLIKTSHTFNDSDSDNIAKVV